MIFGHRYEERYDEKELQANPPPPELFEALFADAGCALDREQAIQALGNAHRKVAQFYVQDVCVRCGDVVERCERQFPLATVGERMPAANAGHAR